MILIPRILPLDLNAKIQVCMSFRLAGVVRRTHRQTHDVKSITSVTDAGCNETALSSTRHKSLRYVLTDTAEVLEK